jgi:tetratricopeptide (TPR) repeat protein
MATNRSRALGVALLLALTAAVFWPVARNGFVPLDDPAYVTRNGMVRQGLTPATVRWAFTTFHASNWHPLTWLSHMVDVELFGLRPAGHHVVSLLLHGAAAASLFLLLAAGTGTTWPGLLVAAGFAIHPLRVESVAWAAERKDVLAACCWMLTLAAYLRYARRPGRARLAGVLLVFALGLTAKPMLVTLPLVLLLLDRWPLGRLRRRADLPGLVAEKAPLLLLAAAASLLTLRAQGEAVVPLAAIPARERVASAAVAAVSYLGKTLWPDPLAVYYPRAPGGTALPAAAAALLLLAGIAALVVRAERRRPYLAAGWWWFLVALLPVLGLVQAGEQAMADRYTYLPSAGLFLAAVWLLRDLARHRPRLRATLLAAGLALLVAWGAVAARQVRVWRDGETLFAHALRVTTDNWLVHFSWGGDLLDRGRAAEAAAHLREAVRLRPSFAEGHFELGLAREQLGDRAGAARAYRETLRLRPGHPEAHNNLGAVLARAGDLDGAILEFRAALAARPDFAEARRNLDEAAAERAAQAPGGPPRSAPGSTPR